MAAQRAAGEAFWGTLNGQLTPSTLRPGLPAAKAALDTLMQHTSSAAAAISMINLMVGSSKDYRDSAALFRLLISPKRTLGCPQIGPVFA
jgi:hypothetical protein